MNPEERRKFMMDFMTVKEHNIDQNTLYKPRDSDIIAVGPPKSGTTWMQNILHQLRTKGDESFDDIYSVTCFLPIPTVPYNYDINAEQEWHPRIYKHHEAYAVLPTTEKQKKIVIFRDPYDTAYSFTKFIDRMYGGDNDMSDSDASEMMSQLHEQDKSDLFTTMASWWKHRQEPNVLIVFYEDLKKDLKFLVNKIADFVEIPLSDEELETVVRLCSFEYMSKHPEKFKTDTVMKVFASSTGTERWQSKMSTVRVDGGTVGEGSKIGPQLKDTVDRLWAETLYEQFGFRNYREMYTKHSCFA